MASWTAGSSAKYFVPVVVTETEPENEPLGELPMSAPAVPESVVGPVFVIPEPAKTAKSFVVPRFTVGCAADAAETATSESIVKPARAIDALEKLEIVF